MHNKNSNKFIYLVGLIPIVWIALLIAPYLNSGLLGIITGFSKSLDEPFNITLCENSKKAILIFVLIYLFGIALYDSNKKNYRNGEEHGSAKWGSIRTIRNKYKLIGFRNNKILTQNVSMGLNTRKHRRNLNTLVVGGSGSGKTRFYCKPNIMQANTSFVILDPKGENLRDTGNLLKEKGYDIKVLDLINMEKSYCYNPFFYIRNENDVIKLATNLIKNTTPKETKSNDPFWDTAAQMLLASLMFYLHSEAPREEQNFEMVGELLRAGGIDENDTITTSALDILMNRLELKDPNHIALKYYKEYKSGAEKTIKSIQITLASRLEKFNLNTVARLTQNDELDLKSLGEKKTALFIIIPDNDSSFNFLIGMLYTQLFQVLFYEADQVYEGSLKVPVEFVMDEFANVCLPDEFEKIISVARSRGISISIILQNLAQLKALFEKQWESIVGNCDTFLYLGGNEQSTHEYVSKLLGNETIDVNSHNKSSGRSEGYSTGYQKQARALLTPDEVRKLDNDYALLFIRGEEPVVDKKFNIKKHPNVDISAINNIRNIYRHGEINNSIAEISIDYRRLKRTKELNTKDDYKSYEVLTEEELKDYLEVV